MNFRHLYGNIVIYKFRKPFIPSCGWIEEQELLNETFTFKRSSTISFERSLI